MLKEHNDRRSEMNNGRIAWVKGQYKLCRLLKRTHSRCPGAPYYDELRADKRVKEVPYEVWLPSLDWDSSLARKAQSWAEYLACREGQCSKKSLTHNTSGENIACTHIKGQIKPEIERDVIDAIEMWWAEATYVTGEDLRSYPGGDRGNKIGHFTQMAWAKTRKVGCGVQRNQREDSKTIVVCNYYPPANYPGQPVAPEYKGLKLTSGGREDGHDLN